MINHININWTQRFELIFIVTFHNIPVFLLPQLTVVGRNIIVFMEMLARTGTFYITFARIDKLYITLPYIDI